MNNQAKCINLKTIDCEQSLVFRFMRTAKWVALLLLIGIGTGSAYIQFQHQQNVNWIFFSVCMVCGIILFWVGHSIMISECVTKRRCGSCSKVTAMNGVPMRQV